MPRKYLNTTHKPGKAGTSKGRNPRTSGKSTASKRQGSASRAGGKSTAKTPFVPFKTIRTLFKHRKGITPRPPKKPRIISTGLSVDRKLDILGIVLSVVGLLTLLALPSTTHGILTGSWLSIIGKAFGWGMYLFPISLLAVGLWLVLRNFDRVPQLSVERLLGIALLYFNLLAIFHFFLFPETDQAAFNLASAGKGGGGIGAFLLNILRTNLGWGGAAVALLAWLMISLGLALDVSVVELFRWFPPLVMRFQDWLDDRRNHKAEPFLAAPHPTATAISTSSMQSRNPQGEPFSPGLAGGSAQPVFIPSAIPGQTYSLPRIEEILDKGKEMAFDDDNDRQRANTIEQTLASFGAPVNVVEINRGPTITQFGVEPDFIENRAGRMRVRVGKIASLADDLALALSARRIRVEAPVPGKGYVGIEVPNEQTSLVALRDVAESEAFKRLKTSLRFALGQDVAGNAVAADLSGMPHLLIAGATGSGKSVCVNALICCLLLNNTPNDLRLVMVDPKRVELTGYNGIPHLLAPVVVETERVVGALQWVLREMDQRYHKLAQMGCRNIAEYNNKVISRGESKLPYLVVIIDELADLMMLAPDETERTLTRLAQLARATGIHLVIATQRPSVDVVTGLIKANFPARIAFAVASGVDSRVILDQPGAERLLGRGDMLFQPPDAPAPIRLQGCWISENEIQRLVQYWQGFSNTAPTSPTAVGGIVDAIPAGIPLKQMPLWEGMEAEPDGDPLLNESVDLVRKQGRASISMLQRRLRIGYTRAARLVETMQEKGIIGKEPGPQGFEVLDYGQAAPPVEEQ